MSREKTLSVCSRWSQPAPPKGELFVIWRQAEQNLPLRGRWHRAAMTERVLSVPPALFLSGLTLSVTFGDTSFPFLSHKRHLPPVGGSLSKGEALAKPSTSCFYQEVYRHAKDSPFGRAVKADRH